VQVTLPSGWEGKEIHFVWDSTGEALLFKDGEPHQGTEWVYHKTALIAFS
jgi:hypothetical protein